MEGYVYILSNVSMPRLLKIGLTTRTPRERADELSRETGVPTPFVIEYSALVVDCRTAERLIHRDLWRYRVNDRREFFAIGLNHAIDAVRDVVDYVGRADRPRQRATWNDSAEEHPLLAAVLLLLRLFLDFTGWLSSQVVADTRWMLSIAGTGVWFIGRWLLSAKGDLLDDERQDVNAVVLIAKLLGLVVAVGVVIVLGIRLISLFSAVPK